MGPGVTVGYAPGRGRARLGKPRMEEVGVKGGSTLAGVQQGMKSRGWGMAVLDVSLVWIGTAR